MWSTTTASPLPQPLEWGHVLAIIVLGECSCRAVLFWPSNVLVSLTHSLLLFTGFPFHFVFFFLSFSEASMVKNYVNNLLGSHQQNEANERAGLTTGTNTQQPPYGALDDNVGRLKRTKTSSGGGDNDDSLFGSSTSDICTPQPTSSGSSSTLSSSGDDDHRKSMVPPSLEDMTGSHTLSVNSLEETEGGGRTTWVMAAFLLINAALGAGLLNYPVAYDRLGGIVYASIIQGFAVVLMATTMLVLVYCARLNNVHSYHDVMRTMCGRRVMQFSAASIAITCFGICITFLIIIGDQFDRIFATYIGDNFCTYWYATRTFTMAATAIATIWPMCYFRRLDFLRHVNVLGVVASFYIIFLNIYSHYTIREDTSSPPPMRTSPKSFLEFVAALPVVFFAYQTHEIVIPVHVSMKDKSIHAFSKSTAAALACLLALYCLAGTYGYQTFGSNVAPDIMLMYNAHDPIVLAGIIALVVKMITTYPPVLFCGRDTIVRILASSRRSKYQSIDDQRSRNETVAQSRYERKYHILITTAWNASVLALALIIPNITVAIGFLGSLASCNVFLFPGLALMSLARNYAHFKLLRDRANPVNRATTASAATTTAAGGSRRNEGDDTEDNDDEDVDVDDMQTLLTFKRRAWYSMRKKWVQVLLTTYGLFIILMGLVMFVIILIQVYHDVQTDIPHGAVCTADTGLAIGNNQTSGH